MIDLVLLGLIGATTIYGEKIRELVYGRPDSLSPTLKVQPGTAKSLAVEKELTRQLHSIPNYELGSDVEDTNDTMSLYKSIDPTLKDRGYENVYMKLLRMKDEK